MLQETIEYPIIICRLRKIPFILITMSRLESEQITMNSWLENIFPDNHSVVPTTDQVVDEYFTLKEQAVFSNIFPGFGLHVAALGRLNRQTENRTKKELPIEEKETLLMYSLWVVDPVKAIEFAWEMDIPEWDVNQYVDDALYKYGENGEKLLNILARLRPEASPEQDGIIQGASRADIASVSALTQDGIVPTATSADYDYSEEPPEPGSRAERYDHPILNRQQEYILVNYLKTGATLEQLLQDKSFQRIMLPEDTSRFARIFAQSKTVSDVLASCYFRLIDVVARGFHTDLPLDDRVNAGSIGLLKAARKWDSAGAAKLSTYAVWDIRNAIHKAVQEDRSSIKIPEYVEQDLGQVRRLSEAFRYIFGRIPTNEELRQQLIANTELPISRIDNVLSVMQSGVQNVRSIHEKLSPESEDELADFIPDENVNVEETVLQTMDDETRQEVRRAMAELLTTEEQRVIKALFGLEGELEQTPWQIAEASGKPIIEVGEITARSLGKLSRDRELRRKWHEDAPSFIYHMSAEDAAFRLGIFDTPEDRFEKRRRRLGLAGGIVFEAQPQPVGLIMPPEEMNENQKVAIDDSIATGTEEASGGSTNARTYFTKIEGRRSIIFRKDNAQVLQDMQEGEEDSDALTLSEQIKALRNQWFDNWQIASKLGIPVEEVAEYSAELIRAGEIVSLQRNGHKRTVEIALESDPTLAQTLVLRKQGLSNWQVSDRLGIPYHQVGKYTSQLVRAGMLPRHPIGVKNAFEVGRAEGLEEYLQQLPEAHGGRSGRPRGELLENVKTLRSRGFDNKQISVMLDVPYATVAVYASSLIKSGDISPQRKGRKHRAVETEEARSEETELVRRYLEANPQPSYRDGFRRIFEAKEKRRGPRGRRPETIGFDSQVKELLEQGLTRTKMAEQLRVAVTTIDSSVHRMIQLGEYVVSSERVRRRWEYNKTQTRIKEMVGQGLNVLQISEALGESLQYTQMIIWRLGRRDEISPSSEQLRPVNRTGYIDKKGTVPKGKLGEVYERVAQMRNQGMKNGEIADTLDLPKHRVEIYASNLIRAGIIKPQLKDKPSQNDRVAELRKEGLSNKRIKPRRERVEKGARVSRERSIDRVKELRNQGYDNHQISQELNLPLSAVEKYVSQLIKAGEIAPLPRSKDRSTDATFLSVRDLRNQGLSNKEIAEKLRIPHATVSVIASKLIRAGEIKRQTLSSQDIGVLEAQIKELRGDGLSQQEIAARLNQPPWRVRKISSRLVKSGQVQPLKTGPKKRK